MYIQWILMLVLWFAGVVLRVMINMVGLAPARELVVIASALCSPELRTGLRRCARREAYSATAAATAVLAKEIVDVVRDLLYINVGLVTWLICAGVTAKLADGAVLTGVLWVCRSVFVDAGTEPCILIAHVQHSVIASTVECAANVVDDVFYESHCLWTCRWSGAEGG